MIEIKRERERETKNERNRKRSKEIEKASDTAKEHERERKQALEKEHDSKGQRKGCRTCAGVVKRASLSCILGKVDLAYSFLRLCVPLYSCVCSCGEDTDNNDGISMYRHE